MATDTGLKRAIGPRTLTLFMLGYIVGAGIYVLVGTVAQTVGGAMWIPFAAALILSLLTASSYAELVTKYPKAGGSSIYVERAFRSPMLGFLTGFVVLASGVTTIATLAISFAGNYLQEIVTLPPIVASLALLLAIVAINLRGARESVGLSIVLTLVELTGLLIIVVIALGVLSSGNGDPSRALQFKSGDVLGLILTGAGLAFFAFTGFDSTTNLAEEVQDPERVYPRALLVSLGIAGVIYLVVTTLTAVVVPTDQLSRSDAPLLEVVRIGGVRISPDTFALISLLSVASSALATVATASRLLWGMSDAGLVHPIFARVLPTRRTPLTATLAIAAVSGVLIATGDVSSLVSVTTALLLAVFLLVNASAILLRKDRVEHEHYRAPGIVPVFGIAACALLLAQQDMTTLAQGVALVALGVVVWMASGIKGRRGKRPSGVSDVYVSPDGTPMTRQGPSIVLGSTSESLADGDGAVAGPIHPDPSRSPR